MADNGSSDNRLRSCVENAWNTAGVRLQTENHLFYDYLTSTKRQGMAHLPAVDEVKRQFPIPAATAPDGRLYDLGGVMLDMIVDRYAVTGEET
jgi:hypothetical protein